MKTRKKTKLCLQCNGVNPMSATHCAYCGAILASEESSQEEGSEFAPSQQVMSDLFAVTKEPTAPASYTPARASQPFVQAREPHLVEDNVTRPLYSVFDQPQTHQIGNLRDELMEKPARINPAALNPSEPAGPAPSQAAGSKPALSSQASAWLGKYFSGSVLEVIASTCLVTGTILASLALLTLIFEESGKVILSWSSDRAPWLFICSLAMLVIGWRALSRSSK